jgi:hypothetical protein
MGARWYDPTAAQFRTRDTVFGELATPVSLNRYTYGFANPLLYWDPDGRYVQLGPLIDGQFASAKAVSEQKAVTQKGKEIRRVREARRIYDEASSRARKASDELNEAARISKLRARYEQELASHDRTAAADPLRETEPDDRSFFESAIRGIGSFVGGAGDVLSDVGDTIADVGATVLDVGARCAVDFINNCSTNVALFISPLVIGGLTLQAAWAWGASCASLVGCVAGTLIFGTATGAGIYGTYRQAQEVWFGPNRDEIYQELAPALGF